MTIDKTIDSIETGLELMGGHLILQREPEGFFLYNTGRDERVNTVPVPLDEPGRFLDWIVDGVIDAFPQDDGRDEERRKYIAGHYVGPEFPYLVDIIRPYLGDIPFEPLADLNPTKQGDRLMTTQFWKADSPLTSFEDFNRWVCQAGNLFEVLECGRGPETSALI